MKCWPWKHDWKLQDSFIDYDNETSTFLYTCKICEKIKTKEVWGLWTVDKFKSNQSQVDRE